MKLSETQRMQVEIYRLKIDNHVKDIRNAVNVVNKMEADKNELVKEHNELIDNFCKEKGINKNDYNFNVETGEFTKIEKEKKKRTKK